MSVDKSLVSRVSMTRARNVYSRAERLEILKKDGRLQFEGQVLGLPKTRVEKVMKKVKAREGEEGRRGRGGGPGAAAPAAAGCGCGRESLPRARSPAPPRLPPRRAEPRRSPRRSS